MQVTPTFFRRQQSGKIRFILCVILFLLFIVPGYSQQLNDSLFSFQENWKFRQVPYQKTDYYLMNNQAFNATLLQSKTLFSFKNRVIGVGIGREVVFNDNSSFVPGQQAFRPIQGMPIYPQFIPVTARPGISIFNRKTNATTLFQVGNLMEGRQGVMNGQIQLGRSWRIL